MDLTGTLEAKHADEGLGNGFATGEQTVVAQDQDVVVAEVFAKPGAFFGVDAGAFEVVVADLAVIAYGVHRDGQQAVGQCRDGHAGSGVSVDDALNVRTHHVDGRVDDKAGGVDLLIPVANDVAFGVDFDEVGSSDFVEAVAVWIDEEVVVWAGDADGGMGPDEFVPAVVVDDAVSGSELGAEFSFDGGHSFDIVTTETRSL